MNVLDANGFSDRLKAFFSVIAHLRSAHPDRIDLYREWILDYATLLDVKKTCIVLI